MVKIWGSILMPAVISIFNKYTQKFQLKKTTLKSILCHLQAHRAPSVGFFLLGISASICILHPSSSCIATIQKEAVWAGKVLAPALVSFDFLWLSEDRNTAHILLLGSCLLLGLYDWMSADTLTVMTRCLGLSSLSCSLTVCLFAGNASGALGAVAFILPLFVAPNVGATTFAPLISAAAAEGVMVWLTNASLSFGCWASTRALHKYLLDLTEWCSKLLLIDVLWYTCMVR